MNKGVLLLCLLLLAACAGPPPSEDDRPSTTDREPATAAPATPTDDGPPTTDHEPATAVPTSVASATPPPAATTPAPTWTPTVVAAATAVATATAGPSGFVPPGPPLEGFTDGLVLATVDGALIVYYPGSGEVETLLGPGEYPIGGDDFFMPIVWPVRFSPDGQWAVIPRPAGDTWLAGPDGARPLHNLRLNATWAPDSRRIAFVAGVNQFETSPPGDVFVQDVVGDGGAGAEAQPLAPLPGGAIWPIWSPGCAEGQSGDCGRSVAVSAAAEGVITLWLIDVETAEQRELGRYRAPPIDGTLWHAWSSDGLAVIGQADSATLAFPLDGSGPRPLVFEQQAPGTPDLSLSNGALLRARLERDAQHRATLIVGDVSTGEEVSAAIQWTQAEGIDWSDDGRYLLVTNYTSCPGGGDACYEVWAVDTADFPALGEPARLAWGSYYLGARSELRARSTEVNELPWAETALLAGGQPGPAESWSRQAWGEGLPAFSAPAGWRVTVTDSTFVVANYDTLGDGLVALGDDRLRIDGYWSDFGGMGSPFDYADLDAMRDTFFNQSVEPITVNGVAGVVLRDTIAPVCERVLLPHGRGELGITYCPATEAWRKVVEAFLIGLEGLDADGR